MSNAYDELYAELLDFVARILVAYGYCRTIQAFRRYGRKP